MPMTSPALAALMAAAMMVAMMLPSVAPTLLRYQRALRAMRVTHARARTTLFAAGYAAVWSVFGVVLWALSARLAPTPWVIPSVVLCAGVAQQSRWKRDRLRRCRQTCVPSSHVPASSMIDWRRGCRLGIDCGSSCAPAMAVLLVIGLMDTWMMLLITAVIATERLSPDGERAARLTGAATVVAGVAMCALAIGAR